MHLHTFLQPDPPRLACLPGNSTAAQAFSAKIHICTQGVARSNLNTQPPGVTWGFAHFVILSEATGQTIILVLNSEKLDMQQSDTRSELEMPVTFASWFGWVGRQKAREE